MLFLQVLYWLFAAALWRVREYNRDDRRHLQTKYYMSEGSMRSRSAAWAYFVAPPLGYRDLGYDIRVDKRDESDNWVEVLGYDWT